MLAVWDKVVAAVVSAYSEDDATSTSLRTKIRKLMERTKFIAAPLFHISKVLKSQKKVDSDTLKSLEIALVRHSVAWRLVFKNKGVFFKLHHLEAHVRDFIVLHGFFGVISEEAFEAFHPLVARVMNNLKPMVSMKQRVRTTFHHLSVGLNQKVQAVLTEVRAKTKGKKRGTYKTKAAPRASQDMDLVSSVLEEDSTGEFLVLADNSMICKEWLEVYNMVANNKVPAAWSRVFEEDDSLGNVKREEAKFGK